MNGWIPVQVQCRHPIASICAHPGAHDVSKTGHPLFLPGPPTLGPEEPLPVLVVLLVSVNI